MHTPQDTDTIVACATPRTPGALAVVRLSGPLSHTIATGTAGRLTPPRTASLVKLRDARCRIIDQALQLVFPAPASFSGEDMVEWHCHGGLQVVDMLLARALELGARAAEPGEFSKRAFLHGKLDLSQAEAIAALIEAGSRRMARLAAGALTGALARPLAESTRQLDWCRAQIEARLDFSDEAIDPATLLQIDERLAESDTQLKALLLQAENNLAYAHSPQVVLAGEPNTGKSTLFNQLLGEERALVSNQAGTTRDLLRESLDCGDTRLRLADTAGLRESDSALEQAGIKLAWEQIAASDLVLLVFDTLQPPPSTLLRRLLKQGTGKRLCLIANKIDLSGEKARVSELKLDNALLPCIRLSAASGAGIDLLREWLLARTRPQEVEEGDAFLVRRRHLDALGETLAQLGEARGRLAQGETNLELAAENLRLARAAIGELSGQGASEELLGRIFSQFCIGK